MVKKAKFYYNASIVFSILLAILGFVMIFSPGTTLDVMCEILAAIVTIEGISLIVMAIKKSNTYLPFEPLVLGVISIIIGIILFIHPSYLETIAGIIVGIWIIVESVYDVSISLKLKETDAPWGLTLCLAIVSLIAGIILLVNPQLSAEALLIWAGIILIINSITSIIDKIVFKNYVNELKKSVKELVKNVEE